MEQNHEREDVELFTAENSVEYLDKLQDLVRDYNKTKHTSIVMTPVEASKNNNEKKVFGKLYGKLSLPRKKETKVFC